MNTCVLGVLLYALFKLKLSGATRVAESTSLQQPSATVQFMKIKLSDLANISVKKTKSVLQLIQTRLKTNSLQNVMEVGMCVK